MSKQRVVVNNKSIGFCGLLTIVLIVLKLLELITISWWWVFSPIWIPIALVLGLIVIMALGTVIFAGISYYK